MLKLAAFRPPLAVIRLYVPGTMVPNVERLIFSPAPADAAPLAAIWSLLPALSSRLSTVLAARLNPPPRLSVLIDKSNRLTPAPAALVAKLPPRRLEPGKTTVPPPMVVGP